jgi:hypothetical protein
MMGAQDSFECLATIGMRTLWLFFDEQRGGKLEGVVLRGSRTWKVTMNAAFRLAGLFSSSGGVK